MRKHKTFVRGLFAASILVSSLAATSQSWSAALLEYDFAGQNGVQISTPVSSVYDDIQATALTRGSGLQPTDVTIDNTMVSKGWGGVQSLETAIAGAKFYEFTITPDEGFSLAVTDIVLSWYRSSSAPKYLTIRTSLDEFASDPTDTFEITATGTTPAVTFAFSGEAFENITSPVTFRVYGWGVTTGGSGGFGNTLTVNGSVTPVPEPQVSLLLGLGLGAVLWRTRKRFLVSA